MIAVLDSGVGGLFILKLIRQSFPGKKITYFADTVNFPYGEKTKQELLAILRQRLKYFVKSGAKIIVIACNTATVSVIDDLRLDFEVPLVGIEPAVKPGVSISSNGRIGLVATERTIKEYNPPKLAENIYLVKRASKTLATMIEKKCGDLSDDYIKSEFDTFLTENIDTIVLGCTHYSYIMDRLKQLYPGTNFIAPETSVVKRVESLVTENKINLADGDIDYFSSAINNNLDDFIKKIGLGNDPIIRLKK